MQSATRAIFFLMTALLLIVGLMDLAEQHRLGEELRWRVPLIFICLGGGGLFIFFAAPNMFSTEIGDSHEPGGGGDCGDGGGGGD